MLPAYRWQKLGFVTFHTSRQSSVVLCFDLAGDARAHVREKLVESKITTSDLHSFSIHTAILGYVVEQLDQAVWSWRDAVRAIEKARSNGQHSAFGDFNHMHEVARHLIHNSEMLTNALSVVDSRRRV